MNIKKKGEIRKYSVAEYLINFQHEIRDKQHFNPIKHNNVESMLLKS